MSKTKQTLMDVAEKSMRQNGYNAISFRDLAAELNIKSASVHYHFRKKEDLGLALVERYSTQFFKALEDQASSAGTSGERLKAFSDTYRAALHGSGAVCLCGVLGAEKSSLPKALAQQVAAFFSDNLKWLENAMPEHWAETRKTAHAARVLATLQGAMMLSHILKQMHLFDDVAEEIYSDVLRY